MLQNLAAAVQQVTMLSTFFFDMSGFRPPKPAYQLPSESLAALIESLPQRCVELEIDTEGYDVAKPGSVHLCDTLRGVLPRLRVFDIRLSTVCPAIFVAGFPTIEDLSALTPVIAPSLQVATVHCFVDSHTERGLSDRPCRVCYPHKIWPEAADLLKACLSGLVRRGGIYPAIERLEVIEPVPDYPRWPRYPYHQLHDILSNTTRGWPTSS